MPERGDVSADGTRFYDGDGWGWQPLWLSRDQVREVAAAEYGIDPTSTALLSDGMLNQTWRLSCSDRDRVLRVGRIERTLDHVRYEDRVVTGWSASIPEIVAAESLHHPVINGRVLTLYPFRAGQPGTQIDPVVRAAAITPVMARMHRISLGRDFGQRPGARSLDEKLASEQWLPVRAAVIQRFGTGPLIMEAARVVDAAVAELDAAVLGWQAEGRELTRAVVHADLNARNQLYAEDRLVGVIDTDECRIEPLVAEVAGIAYSAPEVSVEQVWQDYLDAGGPLEPSDAELLLPFARLGALAELEWFTDETGQATHLADGHLRNLAVDLVDGPVRG